MAERVFMTWAPGVIDGEPPEGVGLYRVATPGRARYLTLLAAKDAGFEVAMTDIKVRRAPQFDSYEFRNGWMPSYARPSAPEGGK